MKHGIVCVEQCWAKLWPRICLYSLLRCCCVGAADRLHRNQRTTNTTKSRPCISQPEYINNAHCLCNIHMSMIYGQSFAVHFERICFVYKMLQCDQCVERALRIEHGPMCVSARTHNSRIMREPRCIRSEPYVQSAALRLTSIEVMCYEKHSFDNCVFLDKKTLWRVENCDHLIFFMIQINGFSLETLPLLSDAFSIIRYHRFQCHFCMRPMNKSNVSIKWNIYYTLYMLMNKFQHRPTRFEMAKNAMKISMKKAQIHLKKKLRRALRGCLFAKEKWYSCYRESQSVNTIRRSWFGWQPDQLLNSTYWHRVIIYCKIKQQLNGFVPIECVKWRDTNIMMHFIVLLDW